MLAHYAVVADPARIQDPNRNGTVESAIQHTQAADHVERDEERDEYRGNPCGLDHK